MFRRFGPFVVATVVVVGLGVFVAWFTAFGSVDEAYGGEVGTGCRPGGPGRAFESFTGMTLVPKTPELAEASRSIREVIGSGRWRIGIESVSSDHPGTRRRTTIVRDGDAVEFRRDDGTRGRLTPDRTLLTTADSTFSLSTCDDPSFTYRVVPKSAACIERRDRGDETVFTFRAAGSEGSECGTRPAAYVDHEIVLRRGSFVRWRFRVVTPARTSTETWSVRSPVSLDGPAPWTVVPGWFVRLMAS